ncbi:MAG: isoprenylcysteine carboxylmethyltransferase family protein [Chloroflexota bacterium]|nr:isoprenylcysteine carboxylmethyltransferase family protein [Chloroflexota bacterium]
MIVEEPFKVNKLDQPLPLWIMLFIPIWIVLLLSVMVFPFARDWRWITGWIFVITISINITVSYMIINKKNPRVLRNRSKLKKTGLTEDTRQAASSDRFVYPLMAIGFFGAMILPALGHRYNWYALPFPIAMVGVIIMNIGVAIINIATLQNSYASKILDINEGQMLVDTGLYSHVRHPLYSGAIVMGFFIPIALGSL